MKNVRSYTLNNIKYYQLHISTDHLHVINELLTRIDLNDGDIIDNLAKLGGTVKALVDKNRKDGHIPA